jgi:uroporphyrin-III C-methyltransferase / precorrin-2 dehydrogenase / sirohydrochlorin ferrochelatase
MTRLPARAAPGRIAPLAILPLFHKLRGRKVVVAGDGDGAVWKAELMLAAGADTHVFAPGGGLAFTHTAALEPGAGVLTLHPRRWTAADLAGAALAVAEVGTDAEATAFADAARQAGVLVNVIDRPAFCDVQFGALVNRSPLVIGISTDGAAPVFGQAVRARIEALLPHGLKAWAEAARDWRPAVQARGFGFAPRRRFWERFTALAFRTPESPPSRSDRDALLAGIGAWPSGSEGKVMFVGAGPGDPGLLTLKAVQALQGADVILQDDLVPQAITDMARREAKRVIVGKTGHGPSCRQSDINGLMIRLATSGQRVVRLKSGDPSVFGRLSEEMRACRTAGVAFEIVPGVTAAQGAAAALGVSLTERRVARRLQFVTGHGEDGQLPEDLSAEALADRRATTIVYMPRRTIRPLLAKALAAGLPPDTPALAIVRATQPDQVCTAGTASTLADRVAETPGSGPMLIMIGQAMADAVAVLARAEIISAQDLAA